MTKFQILRYSIYIFLSVYLFTLVRPFEETVIDPQFIGYYNEFEDLVHKHCTEGQYFHPNFKIEFDDLNGDIIGLCYTYPKRYKVQFDRSFWERADDQERRQLFYHEFSHCQVFADHVDNPKHYMNAYFVLVPKRDLIKQTEDLLEDYCHR